MSYMYVVEEKERKEVMIEIGGQYWPVYLK